MERKEARVPKEQIAVLRQLLKSADLMKHVYPQIFNKWLPPREERRRRRVYWQQVNEVACAAWVRNFQTFRDNMNA